jgi:phage head maturation protease
MQNFSNMLVIDGGTVKAEQEGIVKGMGIVFGSESEPDQSAQRDFFTNETFIRKSTAFTVPLYYNHGVGTIDTEIGEATLTKTEKGWEAEATIDVDDPIGAKVYKAVKKNPHGFSTGALSHLVKRTAKSNNTNFLEQWVVGELSLTERPAERKAVVQSIKSVDGELVEEDWVEYTPVISVKDAEDNEIWNAESEVSFAEFIKNAEEPVKSFEVKYTSGTVQYNLYSYDEETGKGMEMYMTEWGSPEDLLNHVADMISKAKYQLKSEPNEITLEEQVKKIVAELLPNNSEPTNTEALEQELADLKATLSEREDALAQAEKENLNLQILAGAKETLDKVKEN